MKTSWVQRNISPATTKIFARVGFVNRQALARSIRTVSQSFDEREKSRLRLFLLRNGIILPSGRGVDLSEIEHFHFRKTITAKRVNRAADGFYELTGIGDFIRVVPDIVLNKTLTRPTLSPPQVDYGQVLLALRPYLIQEINKTPLADESWEWAVINEAFKGALALTALDSRTAIYRLQKMAQIGGNIQAVVASLFMDVPPEQLPMLLAQIKGEQFNEISGSINHVLQDYHWLREGFSFDPAAVAADNRYICNKMGELIGRTQTPQGLLLFFLYKLTEARQAEKGAPIFGEIRLLLAPLAERLGLIFLADDFRDQCLRLSDPEKYAWIEEKVRQRLNMTYPRAKKFLDDYSRDLFTAIQRELPAGLLLLAYKYRVKSPYSIWNKIEVRGDTTRGGSALTYENIADIRGIKIICDSIPAMRAAKFWLLRKKPLFRANLDSVKEALEAPRRALWRGIKFTGLDIEGRLIEIQLMTAEMNNENTRGRAATWHYNLMKELGGIEQLFELHEPPEVMTASFAENLDQLRRHWIPGLPPTLVYGRS